MPVDVADWSLLGLKPVARIYNRFMDSSYQSFSEHFPMRMTSIEKFHWFDDNDEYPNVVFCRMRIDGQLEENIARQAWQIAVQRQPFADVKPKKINGRWCWEQGPRGDQNGRQCFEDWHGTRFEFEHFDGPAPAWKFRDHLIKSPTGSYLGVFTWPDRDRQSRPSSPDAENGTAAGGQTEVWLYVHHAVGDGAGSILVINDWMIIYANLKSGRDPQKGLHRLDPKLLETRNSIGFFSWRYFKHLWKQPIALFGATKFAFRKTAELIPPNHQSLGQNHRYPSIIGQWIDENQVEQIGQHANKHDVMVNTVLLSQLYLNLAQWRTQQGHHADDDWMRIILPISIRNVSDRRLPTANRATIVQIDRQSRDANDLGAFYRGLNREIMIIRGWQLDKIFLLAIRAMSLTDSMLRRAANNEKSRGMAVFTNLGEPLRKSERAGAREPESEHPIRPREFELVGPIRKGTPVNFAVSRYGPRMRVSLQYDSEIISQSQAQQLLGCYVERLTSLADKD